MARPNCTCTGVGIGSGALITTMLLLLLTGACNSSDGITPITGGGTPTLGGVAQAAHPHVALKDALGNHLTADSKEPYSPRQTCGGCHDYKVISDGYHFQQGRTTSAGDVHMKDDFFEDGRDYLKSDGMYGKW